MDKFLDLGPSLDELRKLVPCLVKKWEAATPEDLVRAIECAIDSAAMQINDDRKDLQNISEDALTSHIRSHLNGMGFPATHDTGSGGHPDLVVKYGAHFQWVAEAKIYRGNEWLLQGFDQLYQRYISGIDGRRHGELIVFCYREKVDEVLENWIQRLREARKSVAVEKGEASAVWRSNHDSLAADGKVYIRHKGISIFLGKFAQAINSSPGE